VKRIYLDNNATTPVDPALFAAYQEALFEHYGNPSSVHHEGREAKSKLIEARQVISGVFGVRPSEVIFFSSATEALNSLILSILQVKKRQHIITSAVEHPAVFERLHSAAREQSITFLEVGSRGAATRAGVEAAINDETALIVLMSANNETGAIAEIKAIADLAYERRVPLLVDAVAHIGKAPLELLGRTVHSNIASSKIGSFSLHPGISALVFSGHKIHAPKGIAASIVRSGFRFTPLLLGGPQESNRRAGTENVAGAVALAKALAYVQQNEMTILQYLNLLRERFENQLKEVLPKISINGATDRASNTSNISFHQVEGEVFLMQLDRAGVAASHGSACSSGSLEPSKVLLNMGLPREQVLSSLRFSFGRFNTLEEIDRAAEVVISIFRKLQR
jgi:cysteine desulfurase